ncbi:AlpA family phage regulatory protein [Laribacter hongkongensis]|uniref:AlpA family phage regulatory protein n=1 Tax=Laribacter hongkongensis TaxID=168471 RepID=A0ABD4SV59_9NEIS|nr:AlpA family phage regulatory protein [Laribacter hongkongensis]MCG9027354.1 AlpA family phage regulatory protein [Laribacter hongkongensis]MCG9033253.1 AlpA family phage regulatory protein [Laribacter hongkongensis]MCG9059211.1 AlpA family phage regulatory protein [Laribacter hongkongensis]MCG9085454.1 AlpA family phage regulatory protein [Laribacter hongkongensis]MCG9093340.1 AlpA family phage regulatory protein [Laribacter hongkongensis]
MQNQTTPLPQTGFVRQSTLVGDRRTGTPGILPFSASTLWRRVRNGTFPAPVKLSCRVTAWKVESVRAFIESAGECQQ